MLNTIALMGRLTRDPELRQTGSGISVCSFSVAVDRDHKGPDGQAQTDFFDCTAWRGTAEFITRYFTKGRLIAISGTLQTRRWEDRNGQKRTGTEIQVLSAYFCDAPKEERVLPAGDDIGQAVGEPDDDLPFDFLR